MAQFTIDPDLQAFIMGFGSKAVANVILSRAFSATTSSYPSSPSGVRRSLISSFLDGNGEYNVRISNLDGSTQFVITLPR